MATDVERMRYYERQYLGATDFDAQQTYHRDSLRRHLLGPHTWGIVTGLDLTSDSAAAGGLDVTIEAGLAVDAFGRTIVLLDRAPLSKDLFDLLPFQSTPQWITVALRYAEETTGTPTPGFESCASGGDAYRIIETYALDLAVEQNPVTVEGATVDPGTLVPDQTVPYQELPEDDSARWTIPLGRVQWQGSADPTVSGTFVDVDATGRVYVGAVAASLLGPDGHIVVRDRASTPPPSEPSELLSVQGTLTATGLVTAGDGLDVAGAVQVRLDPSTQVVVGVVDVANPSGPLDAKVTITDAGDITSAGQVAIGATAAGANRLVVSGAGAPASQQFTVADSGDTQVGGSLKVLGTVEVNSSLSIHDASGGDDTDPLILSRHQRAADQNDLRVQIGDNLDGLDRLVVGPVYFGDQAFKEQFVVDNLGNVSAAGSLSVAGPLRVSGTSNLVVAHVEEFSMQNHAVNQPFEWTSSHPNTFAEVYAAFVVWNGFSLWAQATPEGWGTPADWGHSAATNAIPQHAFVRITDKTSTEYTSGIGYVSESQASQEGDNSALFTVVVLGRGR